MSKANHIQVTESSEHIVVLPPSVVNAVSTLKEVLDNLYSSKGYKLDILLNDNLVFSKSRSKLRMQPVTEQQLKTTIKKDNVVHYEFRNNSNDKS